MKRFTYRTKDGIGILALDASSEWAIGRNQKRHYIITGDAVDRLAAYEDSGLEPDDLKKAFNAGAILKLAAQALGTTPDHLRDLIEAEQALAGKGGNEG